MNTVDVSGVEMVNRWVPALRVVLCRLCHAGDGQLWLARYAAIHA